MNNKAAILIATLALAAATPALAARQPLKVNEHILRGISGGHRDWPMGGAPYVA